MLGAGVVSGVLAAAAVTSGQEEPPSRRCPMLSPPPAASTVVIVVQAVPPNYLCALAVNGTDEEILNWDFRVDRWEAHSWHAVHPRGEAVPWPLRSLWPGRSTEAVVPLAASPLRPGTYRVCLEYRNGNGKEKREACSVPLRLPPSSHWRREEG